MCNSEYHECKCVVKKKHSSGCGCLTDTFISKAHTNFTSILIEAQSQEEFVKRVRALPRHAVDDHSQCDYHPLRTCSCGTCKGNDQITCKGEDYKTRFKLDCKFHALLYEIECYERAKQVKELIHPILKRGHSNALEASHNVFIRFRSKDISLDRLHYHVSTNLALLQANLTYMYAKLGISYHWIPELYRRMNLPVFDGVLEALQSYSLRRKRGLEREKTTPVNRRRIQLKKRRVLEGFERSEWTKRHGRDTYDGDVSDDDVSQEQKQSKGKSRKPSGKTKVKGVCAACGSTSHRRSTHKDCPFKHATTKKGNKPHQGMASPLQGSDTVSDVCSVVEAESETENLDSYGAKSDLCTCDGTSKAHKRDCPMSSRQRYRSHAQSSPPGDTGALSPSRDSLKAPFLGTEPDNVPKDDVTSLQVREMKVGDYVSVHSRRVGGFHLPCRIVREVSGRYQLYCLRGVLDTSFSSAELVPLTGCSASITLEEWRQAPKVSLRSVANDPALIERCNCNTPTPSESIWVSSESEGESKVSELWVNNGAYQLTHHNREVVLSRRGWLTDDIICAAQMMLLQFYPKMAGLQPPVLQKVFAFEVHSGEFVQIVHVRKNHWCVVSTVGCEAGAVHVYDSLYKSVTKELIHLVVSMVHSQSPELNITMMDVEKQSNGSDCGVLAIAYAFDLCSGLNPCSVRFNHSEIRSHLATCLQNCQVSRFEREGKFPSKTQDCRASLLLPHARRDR